MSRYRANKSTHRPGTWEVLDTKRVIFVRNSLTEEAAIAEATRLNAL